jgi:hypothetical protein
LMGLKSLNTQNEKEKRIWIFFIQNIHYSLVETFIYFVNFPIQKLFNFY